ncbi:MAG: TRAP transporter large permease [Desulfobacteraceae bacterium]|jgi:tripartite ATP-independent transporter DctM subunit|nr:TRAP transporter large permease [Desulfobacteraceae bacterium]
MISLLLTILFLVFIAAGVPISMSMGLATLISLICGGYHTFLFIMPQQMVEGVDHAALLAIPFFILAGNLMNASGMTDKIFDFATAVIGHVRGGLAQVNVLASMVFAGVSGAAVADCAGLGIVEIKAMAERGYKRPFAAAVTAASSAVGPIIPPSIPLVIYAYIAGTSVGRMFLGGMVPGIIIGLALMFTNYILSYKHNFPRLERAPISKILRSALDGIVALIAPIIIIGSILTGVVTATESGVLASLYALLIGIIYRNLTLRALWSAFYETMIMTTVIMFIIAIATAMGWLFAYEQIPQTIAASMLSLTTNKYIFLFLLIFFMLAIGCVLEGIPALLITLPILLPLADQFGIDRVHFGLIVVYGLLIGIVTPPMGIALYIMVEVAQVSFEELVVAVLPYLIPLLAVLFLIAYVPEVTTYFPNLLMGVE